MYNRKKICFIAQFPPPISGLTKAVETLYNSNLKEEFIFEKIDIKNNKKFISNLIKIIKSDSDLFYFTISQSKLGNIRDLIILKILELRKKKCLVHLHGGYYRKLVDNDINYIQRKANYSAINKLEGVIVLGNSLRGIFRDMIDESKIFTVKNCIDNEFLLSDKEFLEKVSSINSKEKIKCLYLSNFIESKGYKKVLKAARNLNNKNISNIEFIFAGKFFNKEDENFFYNYVNLNKLNSIVSYKGIVQGDEKKQILKESDIFILMTRYPNEGQPISIIEAMGNGQVILTTNHAGIPDIVENFKNGYIFTEDNEEKLSDEILLLMNKQNERKKMMTENYNKVLNHFTEKQYITNMESLFKGM